MVPEVPLGNRRAAPGAPRVLILSRSYPNPEMELLGVWVERLVRSSLKLCEPRVVAPVPYMPALPGVPAYYSRFRHIPRREERDGVEVWHPRFLAGPGSSLYAADAAIYVLAIRRLVDRLQSESPFDLIHAHFTYPDGVAAVHLGRRYGVPVVITEQVPWGPWLARQRLVRRQASWASRRAGVQIAISKSVRAQIISHTGRSHSVRVVPNGVDGAEFAPVNAARRAERDQILYVGHVNAVKGVDVLLKAMKLIVARRPSARLLLLGATYYRAKRQLANDIYDLAAELQLGDHVQFLGAQSHAELVHYMSSSSVLVLPSRLESFGCVLVEALACGTPVVATRCGGPEDIVHDGVGRLVPTEDPPSLAAAIEEVLDRREEFEADRLRAYALEHFSWDRVAAQTAAVYHDALASRQ